MKIAIAALGVVPLIWLLCWIHSLVTHPFRGADSWEWPWYARFFPLDLSMILVVVIYLAWVIYLWVEEKPK